MMPAAVGQLAEQSTIKLKFEDSNPATVTKLAENKKNIFYSHFL
jgi:hypothetical protein